MGRKISQDRKSRFSFGPFAFECFEFVSDFVLRISNLTSLRHAINRSRRPVSPGPQQQPVPGAEAAPPRQEHHRHGTQGGGPHQHDHHHDLVADGGQRIDPG